MIEIIPAIEFGEVTAINDEPVGPVKQESKPATTASVADELLKLKQLLDAGAITKDEYESQKKKLLN
ncbi:SHOCT domain-containing protein [Spirosoma sp. BT702]|uniref:SHOCT domain-containing protein n=2 Tax=Spirosoma profusum TaxID=2771354 RepID=A0A927AW55_9BACT|nr:SHOCT domain-containing protein [Spirosoma profusum]